MLYWLCKVVPTLRTVAVWCACPVSPALGCGDATCSTSGLGFPDRRKASVYTGAFRLFRGSALSGSARIHHPVTSGSKLSLDVTPRRQLRISPVAGRISRSAKLRRGKLNETTPRRILRTPEAAAYCGSAASTFEKFRLSGNGPAFIRLGNRAVGYDIGDLDHWIDSQRHWSTSEKKKRY